MNTAEIVAGLKTLDTTTLSDAMERIGLPIGGLRGIRPILPGKVICGPAFTVRFKTVETTKDPAGDFLDDVQPGQVVAIDNRGRTDSTVWGDIMAISAKLRGVEGTVIDGVCRDVPGIAKADYPIFSRGAYMITGKGRTTVEAVNVPVVMADIMVHPGDLLFGDDSGVIVIPAARAEDVLAAGREIAKAEEAIIARLHEGSTLVEARAALGYHSLQSKQG